MPTLPLGWYLAENRQRPLLRPSGQDLRSRTIVVQFPSGTENRTIRTLLKGKKANAFCVDDEVTPRKGGLYKDRVGLLFPLLTMVYSSEVQKL